MNKPDLSYTPSRVAFAGWRIVRDIIRWLSSVVMPTEQDLREAGVYIGQQRE